MSALIIGAGMFSLPYLFIRSGVAVGFVYLAIFAVVFSIIHWMYAEIINNTEGTHRFVGYAKLYLGKAGFYASFLTTVIGLIATLLIYITLSVSFMQIFAPAFGAQLAAVLFWMISAIPVILGIARIANAGFSITLMMIAVILALFFYGASSFNLGNLTTVSPGNIFLPYAAVLFSLGGRSAISSIVNYLRENKLSAQKLNLSIVLGTIAPAVLYALFAVGILGLSGGSASPDAISGLVNIPPMLLLMFAFLGTASLWTSYIFLGLEFKEILKSDFRFKEAMASLLVTILPISLYFMGLNDFLVLIGIAGGIFLATESILVVLMWRKLNKRGPMLHIFSWIIIIVFLAGAFYEASQLFK